MPWWRRRPNRSGLNPLFGQSAPRLAEALEQRVLLSGGLIFTVTSIFPKNANATVAEYTTSGSTVSTLTFTVAPGPVGLAASGSELFALLPDPDAAGGPPFFGLGSIGEVSTSGATVNAQLISGLHDPTAIAISGSDLFVTDSNGTIGEYTTSGATVNASLVSGLVSPSGIAVSGSDLFVVNGSSIGEYTTSGATVNASLVTAAVGQSFNEIAASGSDLFIGDTNGGAVGEYTTAGATVNASLISRSGLSSVTGVAVSGSELFVEDGSGPGGEYTTSGTLVDSFGAEGKYIAVTPVVLPVTPIPNLVFTIQPTNTIVGQSLMSPAITVCLEDQDGDLLSGNNPSVTLSIASGPGGATLGGTSVVQAVSGAAVFSDITLSQPGVYTLTASDGSDAAVTSDSFTITTLLTLANLANNIYTGPTGFGGYTSIPSIGYTTDPANDFAAGAYATADNSQVIVAFRGTVSDSTQDWKDNAALGASMPDQHIGAEVADAVGFVNTILNPAYAANPNVVITFTGYSLGGALAQLLGSKDGYSTYTFNAPGISQFASDFGADFSHFGTGLGPYTTNVNYRIYGDQVSLFGTPFPTVVTLAAPTGIVLPTNVADPDFNAVSFEEQFSELNSMTTVLAQIAANAPAVSSAGEPDDAQAIQSALYPAGVLSPLAGTLTTGINLPITTPGQSVLIGSSGNDLLLSGFAAGAADLKSIALPDLSGVNFYAIRDESGGTWSKWQTLLPGVQDNFSAAVAGLEFEPLNASGQPVVVSNLYLFDIAFASTGTFSGTFVESDNAAETSVTEVTLADSVSSTRTGQTVTFTATVSPLASGGAIPTGTVSFIDTHGVVLGTSNLQSDGTAVFSTAFIQAETDTITASYNGDAIYTPGDSTPAVVTIAASAASPATLGFGRIVLPSSVITGVNFRSTLPLRITNTGANLKGIFTTTLYAEPTSAADGSQIFLATGRERLAIRSGKSKAIAFHIKPLPATLLAGDYNLVMEVMDPNGALSWITSSKVIRVSAAVVRPVVSISNVQPTSFIPGKTASITLTVSNAGNIEAKGILLTVSAFETGSTPVTIFSTSSRRLSIKPLATIRIKLKFKIPASLAAGSYLPSVSLTLNGITTSATGQSLFTVK